MRNRIAVFVGLALLVAVAVGLLRHRQPTRYRTAPALTSVPGDDLLGPIAETVALGLEGKPLSSSLHQPGTALILAYREGVLLARCWHPGPTWDVSLYEAALKTRAELTRQKAEPEALYICLGYNYRLCRTIRLPESDQGLLGLEVSNSQETRVLYPIETTTGGLTFADWLRQKGRVQGTKQYYLFDGYQCLLKPGPPPLSGLTATRLNRGRRADKSTIDEALVKNMHELASRQLRDSLGPDGLLDYTYDPRRDQASSTGLTVVRPVMALWALATLAHQQPEEYEKAFQANLAALLKAHYRAGQFTRKEDSLASQAIASLAVRAHGGKPAELLAQLDTGLDENWRSSGKFTRPPGRITRENLNFFPGQALLAWAERYRMAPDPLLASHFLASYRYYREQFAQTHAPTMVPWHTMACSTMARLLHHGEMANFVFEMNDELLQYMQPGGAHPDLEGSFYSTLAHPLYERKLFPQTSTNALYLLGLVDAFQLARERGDQARAKRYRMAILRGLGALRAVQYRHPDELYYLTPKVRRRVTGAFKSAPWTPRIRIDDTALASLALGKILHVFEQKDYTP